MDPVSTIEKVVASGVLMRGLCEFSREGASPEAIASLEKRAGFAVDAGVRTLQARWNGANLDVIRFMSTEEMQVNASDSARLSIANDPAGFCYSIDRSGRVFCEDTDGGETKEVASNVTDFVCRFVFGDRAEEFGGTEWSRDLAAAGLET